ncbi:hypothetical protein [Dialister succinatiphilus]|uniref:Uncharacterized protein n=1 Tax=Dialister succinatiphilus YIT 11850 TaxID=742743 RepID=H1D1L9_9FIRM|nr:hypothetical protein [Dialister succinatiphilus]EHO62547.1 hypothetical protein HMPREF9453_01507 [Dialister succinatiphilus YIT 11850]
MKYKMTVLLACALLLSNGWARAADKNGDVLPRRFSDAMTWNLQNRVEDITITKVAVPSDSASRPKAAEKGKAPSLPDQVSQGSAARNVTEKGVLENQVFGSTGNDENALRITGASVTLKNVEIMKEEGTSSSTENGDFYGMNAALLATGGARVTVEDSAVHSAALNGNGLFSYGKGTGIFAKNVTITTEGSHSGGLQTTGGALTEAENVTVSTAGNSSAAIRSDRGGTVLVKGGTFRTEGYGSPAVYSTARISIEGADLSASRSEGAVIEGKNSIALKNCRMEGNMADTRVMGGETIKEENVHTVMIYQSMSGDAEEGTSAFSMEGGSLLSHKGDVFYVTNTDCTIQLDNVKIQNEDPEGALLRISGNSGSRGWGKAGANGGRARFIVQNQQMEGNILVDSISRLSMTLGKNSRWDGALLQETNDQGHDKDAGADLTIEKGATWNMTADSTVHTLRNEGKIVTNGHTLTVLKK